MNDSQADDALRNVFMAAGRNDLAVGGRGIAVSLSGRNNERFVAHVLPLTGGARRKASSEYSAVAAVFVRKAESDLRHPITIIADTYKLTPAEMRVLMVIVNFGGVPEAAQLLGISETTVKTHLQRVFQKTNTNRQAELVKLVAGFISPFG